MKVRMRRQNDVAVDIEALCAGLEALGLKASERTVQLFARYAELLGKWNRVYNLTAIRSDAEILTHHLLDSASLVPQLKAIAPTAGSVLDVGSGGGLPAVPIAILCPEIRVLAVDAVGKKAAFIQQVAIELGLRNLRAEHVRVEELEGEFDVVTSRAFASLGDFTQLTHHLLGKQSVWLAMKGVQSSVEESELAEQIRIERVIELTVPGLNEERHLYVMRLTGSE